MSSWRPGTPVCLFLYNRPETTEQVFERIEAVEPTTLYVIADGPSPDDPDDEDRCDAARAITESISWDCTVHREYASTNLGLKERFATGLEAVFSREDCAIVLEDDCVPTLDFFRFCETMLEEYADDERVWDVSGSNHLETWKSETQDYHFSYYGGIWGWATWKRAWEEYDPEMSLWTNEDVRERVRDVVADDAQHEYLRTIYDRVYRGEISTWDYQWGFARHRNSGLSVVPSKNLVTNVGFGERATNTDNPESEFAGLDTYDLSFPIEHPEYVAVDRTYDDTYHHHRTAWWERRPLLRKLADRVAQRL